ncbi:MAG: T9SS type A sorting domain-containing protein, partial [Bacteroidia bacterium]|nr:T9SS type A sorting domain-containing protein [Bacteroidia bacterium]
YSIVLSSGTPSYSNLNYWVDSNSIYIDNNITPVVINGPKNGTFKVYPNPFSGSTTVSYSLCTYSNVQLELYSVLGIKLRTIIDSNQSAGEYKYSIDNITSGVYYVHLFVNGNRSTLKAIKVN